MKKRQKIFKKYLNDAINYMQNIYTGVRGNFEGLGREIVSLDKAEERIKELSKDLGKKDFSNLNILEIGSGFGTTLYGLAEKKARCYGIEPDLEAYKVSLKINSKFIKGKKVFIKNVEGESLPYKNNQFDLVISFQVLEHVKNPARVIRETLRVLKPGGFIYFVIPNYNSFWEGHYEVPWMPNLLNHKKIAKLYLKFFHGKRDLDFLDSLNNVTVKQIKDIISKEKVKLLSLGEQKFIERLTKKYNPSWGGTSKLKQVRNFVNRLGIGKQFAEAFISLEWFYPIVLIAKK